MTEPHGLTNREKGRKSETVHGGEPERLMQTSATRHPSEMKKSWKRNFTSLKAWSRQLPSGKKDLIDLQTETRAGKAKLYTTRSLRDSRR